MEGVADQFDTGVRASIASGRLLEGCKALLKAAEEYAEWLRLSPGELRGYLVRFGLDRVLLTIAEVEGKNPPADPLLMWPIWDHLRIDDYVYVPLANAGIRRFGDLVRFPAQDLITLDKVGPRWFSVIERSLASAGLTIAAPDSAPPWDHPVYALPFTAVVTLPASRHERVLQNAGISTVADLVSWTDYRLMRLRGFGPECLAAVETGLARFGITPGSRPAAEKVA
jgi:hypothetical protein